MNILIPYVFFFELPIYTPITIDESTIEIFEKFLNSNTSINAYNPTIKENTTFKVKNCVRNGWVELIESGGMDYSFLTCSRTEEKFYFFYHYSKENNIFQKIGQFPSVADIHISQIKKYDKVLSKSKLKEFVRAIGLAANGVGIGSFVYLRRIFEDLITDSSIHAKKSVAEWDNERFAKQRMSEKIEMLKDFLPIFLVENKNLYRILSVGIHNLKEEECLAYFETVKIGIELILDEKVESYLKLKKIEEAQNKIADLTEKIKTNVTESS